MFAVHNLNDQKTKNSVGTVQQARGSGFIAISGAAGRELNHDQSGKNEHGQK
jgi:hypothetical protein